MADNTYATENDCCASIAAGIRAGDIVPYLGPGVLDGVTEVDTGAAIPADSDSLILAMTDGQPMSPRLMYEFPRAAMHLENKKGRKFLETFLEKTYLQKRWQQSQFHTWLADQDAKYVVDTNRDIQLQTLYQPKPHNLIVGVARIAAHPYRFDIYQWQDDQYQLVELDAVDTSLPVLFKPMGSPLPKPSFIASDADFVDYITELMGGFAIPAWIKEKRKQKQYVFLGMRFTKDTERMVMSDIIYDAKTQAGWAFIPEPTEKERRYLDKRGIEIIEQDWQSLVLPEQASVAV